MLTLSLSAMPMAPVTRRYPVAARNPPSTGYGMKRTTCPNRKCPKMIVAAPVAAEATATNTAIVANKSSVVGSCQPVAMDTPAKERMSAVTSCG